MNFVFQRKDRHNETKNDVNRIPQQEYTAELKEQAVKRAYDVRSIGRIADERGLVERALRNWVKAAKAGNLNLAGAKQIIAAQMELSRLRAQVARLEMDLEVKTEAGAYFAMDLL